MGDILSQFLFLYLFFLFFQEVIPTRYIERVTVKENTNAITIKIDKKNALKNKARLTIANNSSATLSFNTYIECNEAERIIDKLLENNSAEKATGGDSSPRNVRGEF